MISLIAQVIDKAITILIYVVVIRALLSFVPQLKSSKFSILINDVTEPLLRPFKRFQIGGATGAIDFSPVIVIIVLNLIQAFIVRPFF